MKIISNALAVLSGRKSRAEAAKTNYLRHRLTLGLARGAAGAASRRIDFRDPRTWEFSGFSQNGEDGLIDVLVGMLQSCNRTFLEIGASDGTENNTSWLAVVKKWSGVMVEANPDSSRTCRDFLHGLTYGVDAVCAKANPENIGEILEHFAGASPDLFSIDIDSIDYFVASALFESGMRPKICVVEYNSAFGPEESVCFPYSQRPDLPKQTDGISYYGGVSLGGWKTFFGMHGYRFVTVDQAGVNAFFVSSAAFDTDFLDNVVGIGFAENFLQKKTFRAEWPDLYAKIRHLDFHRIS
jgi:hypothetical protein